jgi:hypothetical protein
LPVEIVVSWSVPCWPSPVNAMQGNQLLRPGELSLNHGHCASKLPDRQSLPRWSPGCGLLPTSKKNWKNLHPKLLWSRPRRPQGVVVSKTNTPFFDCGYHGAQRPYFSGKTGVAASRSDDQQAVRKQRLVVGRWPNHKLLWWSLPSGPFLMSQLASRRAAKHFA